MSFKSSGYKSVNAKVVADWAKKTPLNEPIIDRQAVSYGWVVKANPTNLGITSIMTTNEAGEKILDQDSLQIVIEMGIGQLMSFYNKYDTPPNRAIAQSNAFVKDVRVPTRPQSDTLFYVLVDARAFDNIPELGTYALQLTGEGATLHTLAEDYLGYFLNNDRSDMGHRERIGSILKANNIDLETADENAIKAWIAIVNDDPTRDISFKRTGEN